MIKHRDLLVALTRRQYHLRYRRSTVGFAWAILPPIATMLSATLVFDKIVKVDTGEVPYMLFALAALAPWTLFASSMTQGVTAVTASSTMITRLPFPRAVLPLSIVGTALIDLAISSTVFLVFVYASGSSLPATAIWFPLLIAIEVLLTCGVLFYTSALNVFARDIKLGVPLLVQLLLLVTPVMYPLSEVPPEYRSLVLLNPMTGLVENFRNVLLPPGTGIDFELLLPSLIGTFVVLVFGWWYFSATERRFADVV